MRADDLPAESAPLLEGVRKAAYVVDAAGRYQVAPNGGTEAEVAVTEEAVAWFARLADEARRRAETGSGSALEYHMYRQRMDVETLAQATGLWRWRVRRHLRASAFARLSPATRARYAEALGMEPAQLALLEPPPQRDRTSSTRP
jgi:hypothetical protein